MNNPPQGGPQPKPYISFTHAPMLLGLAYPQASKQNTGNGTALQDQQGSHPRQDSRGCRPSCCVAVRAGRRCCSSFLAAARGMITCAGTVAAMATQASSPCQVYCSLSLMLLGACVEGLGFRV